MKVLIWVGSPIGLYRGEDERPLAKVWVDDQKKVHVMALSPEYEEFAQRAQSEIDRRIADPRDRFYRITGGSRRTKGGGREYESRMESSEPGEDNFLTVLKSDPSLVGNGRGQDIAGYEIYDDPSKVVEE